MLSSSSSVSIDEEAEDSGVEPLLPLAPVDLRLMTLRADLETNLVSFEKEKRFTEGVCCTISVALMFLVLLLTMFCKDKMDGVCGG